MAGAAVRRADEVLRLVDAAERLADEALRRVDVAGLEARLAVPELHRHLRRHLWHRATEARERGRYFFPSLPYGRGSDSRIRVSLPYGRGSDSRFRG